MSSASVMPYFRLMLNTVSFRFTLCISRQRDCTGAWTDVFPVGDVAESPVLFVVAVAASVEDGIRITCPMRKFSALSPGLASHMSFAETLYFTVSR